MNDREEAGRYHALERYITALDAGDTQGVAQVLAEAQEDPELDRLVAEANSELHRELFGTEEPDVPENRERWTRETPRWSKRGQIPVYDPEDPIL